VDKFVAQMNRRARLIGMNHARFYNPHGLPPLKPEQENRATCLDMAVLALELQRFPLARQLTATRTADFPRPGKPQTMRNHNHLLGSATCPGVTGMKTGFNRRSGFCLTATCERDGVLLIAVATGFNSSSHRDDFVAALLNWGFQYRTQLDRPPAAVAPAIQPATPARP
jgi:D-alanyl-D-alanine carboxypeptidase